MQRIKVRETLKSRCEKPKEETPAVSENRSRIGTRIVNIDILRDALKCEKCKKLFSLDDIEHQEIEKVADIYSITCHDCSTLNIVPTSDQCVEKLGKKIYYVNCKIALGKCSENVFSY